MINLPCRGRKVVVSTVALLGIVLACHRACEASGTVDGTRPQDRGIEGIWEGKLDAMGTSLRLVFRVERKEDGSLAGSLDSPDQGAYGIPITSVSKEEGGRWTFAVASVGGAFQATLSEDGTRLEGTWSQGPASLPLRCARVEKATEASRPQQPKPPYPYDVEEVTFRNEAGAVTLAGTLVLPRKGGPHPAAVLVSGSGAQDRDETIFGHKPFLVLADALVRRGIAVLRTDDRGVGGSTGSVAMATTEDFVGDVLSGIAYLARRPEIRADRIGIVGHSEGGLVGPLAASRSKDVAFVVMLAGPGLPGDEILFSQGERLLRANGASGEMIRRNRETQARLFEALRGGAAGAGGAPSTEALRAILESDPQVAAQGKEFVEAQVQELLTPWFRFFLSYDPRPALRRVHCPVLAIVGEKDLQVAPEENVEAIEKALQEGGNEDATVRVLPGLNHLFQNCATGTVAEYGTIEETISPEVLKLVGDWIVAHTR